MRNKNIPNDNKPCLLVEFTPIFKKFSNNKNFFYILIVLFSTIYLFFFLYLLLEDKKTNDRILLAKESMLNTEITKAENKKDILEAEVLILRNKVKALTQKHDRKKLAKIYKYLSDTELTGKGIQIILKDGKNELFYTKDDMKIIHNTDLLKIVNLLWENNAIGISINNERLVQNSSISCIGPTILLNKKRINAPFEIIAIGNDFNVDKIKNSPIMLLLNYRGVEANIKTFEHGTIPHGNITTAGKY